MSKDRIGSPSSWADPKAVVAPAVVHRHPLTTAVRVILVIYGLALACVLGGMGWIIYDGQHQDDLDRAAVVKRVEADIEKAKADQALKDAKSNNETRLAVCGFLREVNQSPNVKKLESKFRCDLPVFPVPSPSPSPQPAPRPTVYIYYPAPGPSPQPEASQRPPEPKPSATKKPPASPSPSPTCRLPKPLPCVGPES